MGEKNRLESSNSIQLEIKKSGKKWPSRTGRPGKDGTRLEVGTGDEYIDVLGVEKKVSVPKKDRLPKH